MVGARPDVPFSSSCASDCDFCYHSVDRNLENENRPDGYSTSVWKEEERTKREAG
jgi:2-iminoacetate synthase ThiH